MYYQVVARSVIGEAEEEPAQWEYYPYWAPGRERAAAERLAVYAAQNGREAAILCGETVTVLELLARPIVERQNAQLIPALRYVPGARVARSDGWTEHEVTTVLHLSPEFDPYLDGPARFELDRCRLELELGPGGDITCEGTKRFDLVQLPRRMDVLSAWLRLRERVERGHLGGPADGATAAVIDSAPDDTTEGAPDGAEG